MKITSKLTSFCTALLLLASMPVTAVPVTIDFELGWLSNSSGGMFDIFPKSVGSGSVTFDTDTPAAFASSTNGNFARYTDFSSHPVSWEFNWGGMSFASDLAFILDASGSRIDVTDDYVSSAGKDQFVIRQKSSLTGNANNPFNNTIMTFEFWLVNDEDDCPCDPLTSASLPGSFDLSLWDRAVMNFNIIYTPDGESSPVSDNLSLWTSDVGANLSFVNQSTSEDTPVPEPSPMLLFIVGMMLLGYKLKKGDKLA